MRDAIDDEALAAMKEDGANVTQAAADRIARVDTALAKQLQRSMEENARLKNGLEAVLAQIVQTGWIRTEALQKLVDGREVTIGGKVIKARK